MTQKMPLRQRLEYYSIPEPNSGCWLWLSHLDKDGYGILQSDRKAKKAHRLSYAEFVGPVPDGLLVCHRCDNASCINPEHLFLGTAQDNSDDMKAKGRYRAGGKPFPGEVNGMAVLTEKQAIELILSDRPYGFVLRMARHYGLHKTTISNIIHGKSWKHLPRDRDALLGRWAVLGGVH